MSDTVGKLHEFAQLDAAFFACYASSIPHFCKMGISIPHFCKMGILEMGIFGMGYFVHRRRIGQLRYYTKIMRGDHDMDSMEKIKEWVIKKIKDFLSITLTRRSLKPEVSGSFDKALIDIEAAGLRSKQQVETP